MISYGTQTTVSNNKKKGGVTFTRHVEKGNGEGKVMR